MGYKIKIINPLHIIPIESEKFNVLERGLLDIGVLPPLGLAIIKAFLEKHGYQIDLDDLNIKVHYENAFSKNKIDFRSLISKNITKDLMEGKISEEFYQLAEDILKRTHYKGYDLIGFSIIRDFDISLTNFIILISQVLKEKTDSKILLGGYITQDFFKKLDYIDYFIHGDQYALLYLLERLTEQPKKGHLKEIYNHFRIRGKEIMMIKPWAFYKKTLGTKKGVAIQDDYFIKPNFDGLPLEKYSFNNLVLRKIGTPTIILPYKFSIGCLNKCAFCNSSSSETCYVKNPKEVAKDLEELTKRYKTTFFMFLNDNINPSYGYAKNICREIREHNLNIKWSDCANFRLMDKKLLNDLKKAGAVRLVFGLECASQKMLDYIKKGVNLSHAKKILQYSDKIGIWNELELIAGLPYETDGDIISTINFIKENIKCIDYCSINQFRLEHNSLFRLNPENYGLERVQPNLKEPYDPTFFRFRFDEKHNLKWEDKKKQILSSYNTIVKFLTEQKLFCRASKTHLFGIFYHYEICGYNKEEVKKVMNLNQPWLYPFK